MESGPTESVQASVDLLCIAEASQYCAAHHTAVSKMNRSLGFWRTWALVVGAMIGSVVFVLPTLLAPFGRLSLVGWAISALGSLCIALTFGSLATRIPKIGGPYAYTREAFGDLPAFVVAWGFWISISTGIALVSVAFSGYMSVFIPWLATPMGGAVGAILLIWILTGINLSGVRSAGIVGLVMTLLKIIPLIVVGVVGLTIGEVSPLAPAEPVEGSFFLAFAGIILLTMGAFVGIEAGTIPADDVIKPEKTIPRAMLAGTLTATVVYMLATSGVMSLIPADELSQSVSPFSGAASSVFGDWGAKAVAVGAIISIVGVLNANILLASQMPRAAALDRLFPARLANLNSRNAPSFSMLISVAFAISLIALNYTKGIVGAFELMLLLTTITALIPYFAGALAEFALKRRGGEAIGWKTTLYAGGALVFSLVAIFGSGIEAFIYGIILLLLGLPVYFRTKRQREA